MADPRTSLAPRFEAALRAAFGDEYATIDPVIHRSERADFQADVAMGLAKKVGKPPRDVAKLIVDQLDVKDICEKVEVAGPGFVNLTLSPTFLAREVGIIARDPHAGLTPALAPETVVIDYSAPNVAKEMHVGHIRSTVIGDSLSRVLEALGHRVIRQNHLGDWGTQFGMLIEQLLDVGEEALAASMSDLDAFYKQARTKFDSDPAFAERARQRVVLLQSGDEATLARWRLLTGASRTYFAAVYAQLGVKLRDEDICGESHYNPLLPGVVTELEQKGLAVESDGAMCVFPAGFKTRDDSPLPLIVRKRDGGYGYAATDLAAIRERTQTLKATRILYVIGAPQQQHLAMVFSVAKTAGWLVEPARAEHVAFGSILGPDKKPFRAREGESVKLAALLEEAVKRAAAQIAEKDKDKKNLDEATRAVLARQLGIGAVKYVDLSSERIKDYVFDWERMLATVGNTAPYLQYAHARGSKLLRDATPEDLEASKSADLLLGHDLERALALELLGFGEAVHSVAESLHPHRLCTYLFAIATRFNVFYDNENCPILKSDDVAVRRSRLALSSLTLRILAKGLDLLGIEAPQRM
jgi:arginyl-tRNA synthetase